MNPGFATRHPCWFVTLMEARFNAAKQVNGWGYPHP